MKTSRPNVVIIPELPKQFDGLIEKHKVDQPLLSLNILDLVSKIKGIENSEVRRRNLFEYIFKNNKQNADVSIRFALLLEKEKNLKRCKEILLPFESEIKGSEGARILGEIFINEGSYEQAYQFFSPYIKSKLKRIKEVHEYYYSIADKVRQDGLNFLNRNPNSPEYKRIEKLNKEDQANAVEAYLDNFSRGNREIKKALVELEKISKIVPTALDLGMLQLQRARETSSKEDRKRELKAAEEVFLSISNFMGDNANYKLSLGEVYYWLDKSDKGATLFEEVLTGSKRDYVTLLTVSQSYRGVGEVIKARKLAEEAFQKAKTAVEKDDAIVFRSVLHIDTDDQMVWLKKSSSKRSDIEMRLNSALGSKALEDGENDLAATYIQKTIATHESLPEDKQSFNNLALEYSSLFHATGELKHFKRSYQLIKRALNLNPKNTVVMSNTISSLLSYAQLNLINERIKFSEVGITSPDSLMGHMYKTKKERDRFVEKINMSPEYIEAKQLSKKILLLAPKSVNSYTTAYSVYTLTHDAENINKLEELLEGANLDLTDLENVYIKTYKGDNTEEKYKSTQNLLIKCKELLLKAKASNHKLNQSILLSRLSGLNMLAEKYKPSNRSNEIVSLAKEAYSFNQSSSSRNNLCNALACRAIYDLGISNPEISELKKITRYSLDNDTLIIFLLSQNKNNYTLLMNNKDIVEFISLKEAIEIDFPSSCDVNYWAINRFNEKQKVNEIVKRVMQYELGLNMMSIWGKITPMNAEVVINNYLIALMNEGQDKADYILAQAEMKNIPLP